MRKIGIFGGTFNPVHNGHLMVAAYMAEWTGLDEVWLTLSPQNPMKSAAGTGATDADRLAMLQLACDRSKLLRVCDRELHMPRPSYTYDTLCSLSNLYPQYRFSLIIGSDNWHIFDKWRNYRRIISEFGVIIYPRPDYPVDPATLPAGVQLAEAPVCSLSSTFLRNAVAAGHRIEQMVPHPVLQYIISHHLYSSK